MPTLNIDNREVTVPPGATLLDAARLLGIDVPTLCHRDGLPPSTSCLVCMVKLAGRDRLVPACATMAEDGMRVESETDEVHDVRRTALELLLTEHLGDCLAPCWFGCPANMDIPLMLRQIAAGDFVAAIATVKRDIALPATLGRICPAPCERVCRRGQGTEGRAAAVPICLLKRFVADVDLASGEPYKPECAPPSNKRVAIVGAGPSGLSAACYLRQLGHACTLIDRREQPGGRLLDQTTQEELPRDVLRAEIDTILGLGIELRLNTEVDEGLGVRADADSSPRPLGEGLGVRADATLLTFGAQRTSTRWQADLEHGIFHLPTSTERTLVIRSAADGKEVAVAIDQYLRGQPVTGTPKPFNTKMGRLDPREIAAMTALAADIPRTEPDDLAAGYSAATAIEQSTRCLHCDCRALHDCKLRHYAAQYNANPRRHGSSERRFELFRGMSDATGISPVPPSPHPNPLPEAEGTEADGPHPSPLVYEPGKCIACGLCVQIAERAGERLGLTFVGRGFDVRVGVPLGESFTEALKHAAAECVDACPTGALAWDDDTPI